MRDNDKAQTKADEAAKYVLENEESLLRLAIAKTMTVYSTTLSAADLRNHEAAKKAYADYVARQAAGFKQADALRHLRAAGYKIGARKLAYDWHGFKKQKDGTVNPREIDAYAKTLRKLDGSDMVGENATKLAAEIRKITAEADKRELEVQRLRGEVISRAEVEQQFAARAAFLAGSLRNFGHSHIPKLMVLVKADMAYAAVGIEYYLNELDNLFDSYVRPLQFSADEVMDDGDTMGGGGTASMDEAGALNA